MNKVMIIGRLGRDPELRYAATGSPIAYLRIATSEHYIDRDDNKIERTEWHTIVVFQQQAKNCQIYLKKGSLVFVEGSIQTRKWQNQYGQDRYSTEIKAQRVQFLDRKETNFDEKNMINNNDSHHDHSSRNNQGSKVLDINGGIVDFDEAFGWIFPNKASEMDDCPWDMPNKHIVSDQKTEQSELDKVPF